MCIAHYFRLNKLIINKLQRFYFTLFCALVYTFIITYLNSDI